MPRVPLVKEDYTLGYNTRDNPSKIPTRSCQDLVNAFPGSAPQPRAGITRFFGAPSVTLDAGVHIPLETANGVRLFLWNGSVWFVVSQGGVGYDLLPGGDAFPESATAGRVSWEVVNDSIYVHTSDVTLPLFIIEPYTTGIGFQMRKGWIERGRLVVNTELDELVGSDPGIRSNAFIGFAATFVRRTDAAAFDGGNALLMEPDSDTHFLFDPGQLESVDLLEDRTVWPNGDFADPGVNAWIAVTITPSIAYANFDPQITHVRLWRTDEAYQPGVAEGLSLRWCADLPVRGPNTSWNDTNFSYLEKKPESVIEGVTDTLKTLGYNERPPIADMSIYNGGRLWAGYTAAIRQAHGRWFYSEVPQDVERPQKWLSMFRTDTYFKDTDLSDSAQASAIKSVGADIFFFSALGAPYFLRNGDPDASEPVAIPDAPGCPFPLTIATELDGCYYLSKDGPYFISNRQATPLTAFTAGEVWPLCYNGRQGDLFLDGITTIRYDVSGFFFNETWWICCRARNIFLGHYIPVSMVAEGPLRVLPAKAGMIPDRGYQLQYGCLIVSNDAYPGEIPAFHAWRFLDPATQSDDGAGYSISAKSKRFYVNGQDPSVMAEMMEIVFFASWTDAGLLYFEVAGDGFRFIKRLRYGGSTLTSDPALVRAPGILADFRQSIRFILNPGAIGRNFEVSWSKRRAAPFDFQHIGFRAEVMPLGSWGEEYVGPSPYTTPRIIDAGIAGEDRSAFPVIDAGNVGRNSENFDTILDAQVRS